MKWITHTIHVWNIKLDFVDKRAPQHNVLQRLPRHILDTCKIPQCFTRVRPTYCMRIIRMSIYNNRRLLILRHNLSDYDVWNLHTSSQGYLSATFLWLLYWGRSIDTSKIVGCASTTGVSWFPRYRLYPPDWSDRAQTQRTYLRSTPHEIQEKCHTLMPFLGLIVSS